MKKNLRIVTGLTLFFSFSMPAFAVVTTLSPQRALLLENTAAFQTATQQTATQEPATSATQTSSPTAAPLNVSPLLRNAELRAAEHLDYVGWLRTPANPPTPYSDNQISRRY